jgi:hypothetical protein
MSAVMERVRFTSAPDAKLIKLAVACTELGYTKLGTALGGKLISVLRDLDIRPLVPGQVAAYQKKRAGNTMWSGQIKGIWTSLTGLAMTFGLFSWLSRVSDWKTFHAANLLAIITVIAGVVLTCIGSVYLLDDSNRGTRKTRYWHRFDLRAFSGAVPTEVLEKAVRIHQAMPEAGLFIDQLAEREERAERVVRLNDPFLVAVFRDEIYYIDVWDEKEYDLT